MKNWNVEKEIHEVSGFGNLELLAKQVVEGFISGLHKSPFHGFSSEFAEHKIYNQGESTKHIDWKLYARSDKLYTKRYDEETNLRCHLIIDNSSSMHYPKRKEYSLDSLNKISFSVLASAAIMNLMKRQRDAVGLSVYGEEYEFYTSEKGGDRHHHLLLNRLNELLWQPRTQVKTKTHEHLHLIAEKLKRRSLVFLFTDMLQDDVEQEALFDALQHLRYNKHEVVMFHTVDKATEMDFEFSNQPKRFVDVETGEHMDLYADTIRTSYEQTVKEYFEALKLQCAKYRIKYVFSDIQQGFEKLLITYLVERRKFD